MMQEVRANKRLSCGDVLEIALDDGTLGYVQAVERYPDYHWLVRILPGKYQARPSHEEFDALCAGPEHSMRFFLAAQSLKAGLVERVGNTTMPEAAKQVPLMKVPSPAAGGLFTYNYWQGELGESIGLELTPEQARLPIAGVANVAYLADVMSTGRWVDVLKPAGQARRAMTASPASSHVLTVTDSATSNEHALLFRDDDFVEFVEEFESRGLDGNGYSWENLARFLIEDASLPLGSFEFDSEAGMMAVYSRDRAALVALADLLNASLAPGALGELLDRAGIEE